MARAPDAHAISAATAPLAKRPAADTLRFVKPSGNDCALEDEGFLTAKLFLPSIRVRAARRRTTVHAAAAETLEALKHPSALPMGQVAGMVGTGVGAAAANARAAIVFSDILVPVEAMGLEVVFGNGGPQITNPVSTLEDVKNLHIPVPEKDCPWPAETIRAVLPQIGGRP